MVSKRNHRKWTTPSSVRLALLYTAFCAIAISVNVGTQKLAVLAFPFAILGSIFAGTATGLVVKYLLDKRFIFRFVPMSAAHDGRTFVLYTMMGLATTGLFWAIEYGFWLGFGTATMRYVGAFVGLVIGYTIKYQLDKHFVFKPAALSASARS